MLFFQALRCQNNLKLRMEQLTEKKSLKTLLILCFGFHNLNNLFVNIFFENKNPKTTVKKQNPKNTL